MQPGVRVNGEVRRRCESRLATIGGYGPRIRRIVTTNHISPQLVNKKPVSQTIPRPTRRQLATLTAQVFTNKHFSYTDSTDDALSWRAVRQGVQHVIFILKENRTYDQILVEPCNRQCDPNLAMFGESVTPNQHNLALSFVTVDNFMDTAEVSYDRLGVVHFGSKLGRGRTTILGGLRLSRPQLGRRHVTAM